MTVENVVGRVEKVFLGITEDNNIVLVDFGVRAQGFSINGGGTFSVSFDVVRPFEYNSDTALEILEERVDYWDSCEVVGILKDNDIKYSELAGYVFERDGIEAVYDTSLYPESFDINDKEIYFESVSGGQSDVRGEMHRSVLSKDETAELFEMWDTYHLRRVEDIPKEDLETIKDLVSKLDKVETDIMVEVFCEELIKNGNL